LFRIALESLTKQAFLPASVPIIRQLEGDCQTAAPDAFVFHSILATLCSFKPEHGCQEQNASQGSSTSANITLRGGVAQLIIAAY
jgi:hypothetical protein